MRGNAIWKKSSKERRRGEYRGIRTRRRTAKERDKLSESVDGQERDG